MHKFHGFYKKKSYFEGWYFKIQQGNSTIAFIPGMHINKNGRISAFIQVITEETSYYITYPIQKFFIMPNRLVVKIGSSVFSDKGMKINIKEEGLRIKGIINFGALTPIKYNIMGPFAYIPFMECKHGVISLRHRLSGRLLVNQKKISFSEGNGYIETDWGKSFPKAYLWTQCNNFGENRCAVMASVANIPFLGRQFRGCICVVYFRGKEYRFATYLGVKILRCNQKQLHLQQGKYELKVSLLESNQKKLLAPKSGDMSVVIHESAACKARYRFFIAGKLEFDYVSDYAGFEFVNAQ